MFSKAVVQWNHVRSGGLEIHKRMSSNPGHGSKGDWASTRDNGSQMGSVSDRRSPLGSFL